MRNVIQMVVLSGLVLVGCVAETTHAEQYIGDLRIVHEEPALDQMIEGVTIGLTPEGSDATLTIDGCTVALRLVTHPEVERRRWVLADETQECETGLVEQALVGDPTRREPPEPGSQLDVEMWMVRDGYHLMLVVLGAQRVE